LGKEQKEKANAHSHRVFVIRCSRWGKRNEGAVRKGELGGGKEREGYWHVGGHSGQKQANLARASAGKKSNSIKGLKRGKALGSKLANSSKCCFNQILKQRKRGSVERRRLEYSTLETFWSKN